MKGLFRTFSSSLWLSTSIAGPGFAQSALPELAFERLATAESRLPGRLSNLIYNDPAMRAEIRRVGFEKGCRAVADSRRDVGMKFVPALVPATVAAIRKIVPEPQFSEMRPRSFVVSPLRIYAKRIDAEIDRTAPEILTVAYDAMRKSFLERLRQYPTTQNPADNIVVPRADIAAFGNLEGPYDLDNPVHLSIACADLFISAKMRPTITTAPVDPILLSCRNSVALGEPRFTGRRFRLIGVLIGRSPCCLDMAAIL
ncbi:hypothetical protein [Sphingomonas sp. KC8]|uniref:hypothetical protein n=1 Tax=Sphingomonas sp. KC8 TaxID=1030157 RepID=UPI0002489784|nr:hypothetical protein [Sphingomonas sp. KC8]ARS26596.1 hypothetical protein KC8_04740 [Sphingomonas sp. KC8]